MAPAATATSPRWRTRRLAPDRLDPAGRLRLPGRRTLWRLGAVAALLLTAAGALHAGTQPRPAPDPAVATPGARHAVDVETDPPAAPDPADQPVRLPVPPGAVGVPVRLGDPAGLSLLHPGDRVDLFAVATSGDLVRLATGVTVLAVDAPAAALLLALSEQQSQDVVAAAPTAAFAITIRP